MYIDSIVHTLNIASKEEVRVFLFSHDQGGVGLLAKICIGECAIVAVRLSGHVLDIMYVVPGLVNQVILESFSSHVPMLDAVILLHLQRKIPGLSY